MSDPLRRPPVHMSMWTSYPTESFGGELGAWDRWAVTRPDVVREAMLAEGFCPEGHGPLARSVHPEFYAWCHTCDIGWGIQAVYQGDERVDIEVIQTSRHSSYPGGAGPEQPVLPGSVDTFRYPEAYSPQFAAARIGHSPTPGAIATRPGRVLLHAQRVQEGPPPK